MFYNSFCSQWGDALFVSIQLVIIVMQLLYYAGNAQWSAGFFAFVWMLSMAVYTGYAPFWMLTALQTFTIPIVIVAKVKKTFVFENDQNTAFL